VAIMLAGFGWRLSFVMCVHNLHFFWLRVLSSTADVRPIRSLQRHTST
jgi:hypothetical protein